MNRFLCCFGALLPLLVSAVDPEELQKIRTAFYAGHEHEQQGKISEALRAYLSTPGGEHAAARLARKHPDIAKKAIEDLDGNGTSIRVLLIEAELLLADGENDAALAKFKAYVEQIGEGVPADYYPVETKPVGGAPPGFSHSHGIWPQAALPFELGPGSHVDNWLIRRFIALEAWDEATAEFTRIQAIHDRHDRIDPLTLQFALDHAFFMLERDRGEEARQLLSRHFAELDLDHRLGIRGDQFGRGCAWIPRGISHDEFIRLAWGAFKKAEKQGELISAIKKQIDEGRNEARRVLSKLRFHEGDLESALELELAYIEAGEFSPVSTAIRQGQIFETFNQHAKAAEAFEKALELPAEQNIDLPTEGFAGHAAHFPQQAPPQALALPPGANFAMPYRGMVLQKLEAAYSALSQPDRGLKTRLRSWDEDPGQANRFEAVATLASLAKATSLEAEFNRWADAARANANDFSPQARANLHWIRGDVEGTLDAIRQEATPNSKHVIMYFDGWMDRFETPEQKRQLLELLIEESPQVGRYRLELLNLSDDESPEALIAMYEALFDPDAQPAFQRGKGAYNRTQFENYWDLAHRLMRLYVRTGQREKMEELGLKMIREVEPFPQPDPWNDRGHGQRAAAYLISQAGEDTLGALAVILSAEKWPQARKQLDWTLAGGVKGSIDALERKDPIPWSGPAGVEIIVSDENVTELARNESHLFAGQPWGVSVYDFDGQLLRRVVLGEAALRLVATENEVWVGTPIGLRRVDLKTWEVSQLRLDQEVSAEEKQREDYGLAYRNGVTGLALQGDTLWIGSRQNIRTLDTKTLEMRIFSKRELGVKNSQDWGGFYFDDETGHVWTAGYGASRRYDPDTDTWEAIGWKSPRDVPRFLGRFDGKLWADVYIDDELRHRPAILDPETLEAEPIRISAAVDYEQRRYLSEFRIYGRWNGNLVMGPNYAKFMLNPETNMLDPLPEGWDADTMLDDTFLPQKHRGGFVRARPDGSIRGEYRTFTQLPDGRVAMGALLDRSPRYIYPSEDWPFEAMVWELRPGSGGLHLFDAPDAEPRRISGRGLAADQVFDAIDGYGGIWLCTRGGISLNYGNSHTVLNFDRSHGLPVNRSTGVVRLDNDFWFAARHDDHDGALVKFDPKTSLFTTNDRNDGLNSNAVEAVSVEDRNLKIEFGVEYRRFGNGGYQQFPPTTYNPRSGKFSPRSEPEIFDQNTGNKRAMRPRGEPMPLLGGSIIKEFEHGGRTWLLGTRGVVIFEGAIEVAAIPEIEVSVTQDPRRQLLADARELRGKNLSFEEGIAHENPFVVADTLAKIREKLKPDQLEMVAGFLDSKTLELRSTAMVLLYHSELPEAAEHLRKLLNDRNPEIRGMATLALTKLPDEPLPLKQLEELLDPATSLGNPAFGASSNWGAVASRENALYAIAQHPEKIDEKVLDLLLRFPPYFRSYDHAEKTLPGIGAAIKAKPELANTLLGANDTRNAGGTTNRDFAREVFRFTGRGVLPILHEALQSEDRVIRANAALGCGAVGAPESTQQLLAALDLESGLSKGAIVWALGELKAAEAIDRLTELYLEARVAEKRRYAGGLQFQQAAAVNQQERRELASLENLRADWDELKAREENANAPADPRHDEPLLSPAMVLEALGKIGPERAQAFYRSVAADEQDPTGRIEAARNLIHAGEDEREASVASLRMLAADAGNSALQAAAGVSLLLMGEEKEGEAAILTSLSGQWSGPVLNELWQRVEDRSVLEFAHELLEKIAKDPNAHQTQRERAEGLRMAQ